jgi:hypothetical protein
MAKVGRHNNNASHYQMMQLLFLMIKDPKEGEQD